MGEGERTIRERQADELQRVARDLAIELIDKSHYHSVSFTRGGHIDKCRVVSEVCVQKQEHTSFISIQFCESSLSVSIVSADKINLKMASSIINTIRELGWEMR